MRIISTILFSLTLLFISVDGKTQVDPHFSQYYAYPLYLNPAMTGIINGDYRATAIYRNQWSNVDKAFSTTGISADMTTRKNLNVGVNILNQTAGNGGYNYLDAYVSLAYTGLQLDKDGYQRIVIGMQAGLTSRRFDPAKMKFGDQWVPNTGFDPSIPTGDVFTKTSATAFNANAGVLYFNGDPYAKINVYGGFSVANLTQPEDPFLSAGNKQNLPMRYTVHGGLRAYLSDQVSIIPNFIYMRQGNADEKMLGAYVQMKASETNDVMLGMNYRFDDAISPYAGLYFNNMIVGLSYDINTSNLGKAVSNVNSMELSLTWTGKRADKLPNYFYMCPRL